MRELIGRSRVRESTVRSWLRESIIVIRVMDLNALSNHLGYRDLLQVRATTIALNFPVCFLRQFFHTTIHKPKS